MMRIVRWRVISESEGHVTDRDSRADAEKRADEMNEEVGLPDDHHVEKHVEVYA